jgi:hypothetical protein
MTVLVGVMFGLVKCAERCAIAKSVLLSLRASVDDAGVDGFVDDRAFHS